MYKGEHTDCLLLKSPDSHGFNLFLSCTIIVLGFMLVHYFTMDDVVADLVLD